MMKLHIRDILGIERVSSQHCDEIAHRGVRDVVSDSRNVRSSCVFVAFRGQRVDGHSFVHEVAASGALLSVVDQRWYRKHRDECAALPLVVVRDTMRAWGEIARLYRQSFDVPLIAITGSNGKTSTKEMVAAVLASKYDVLSTRGNFNNHIGLPATLFRLRDTHEVVVTEMGTNQPGDIAWLCDIAAPTVGMITNIGSAHLERLKSREGIAEEKRVLLTRLPQGGVAVVDGDEPLLRARVPRGVTAIRFGTARGADVRIRDIRLDALGHPHVVLEAPAFVKAPIRLALQSHGRHAARNAAAAVAVGFAMGCGVRAMKRALEQLGSVDRRLQVTKVAGVTIINDTYNANPESMRAGLQLLADMSVDGERIAVLGDMMELGTSSRAEHAAVGAAVVEAGIPWLFTFGSRATAIRSAASEGVRLAVHYREAAALGDALCAMVQPGDAVLVKGSRSMQMENIVEYLTRHLTDEEGGV